MPDGSGALSRANGRCFFAPIVPVLHVRSRRNLAEGALGEKLRLFGTMVREAKYVGLKVGGEENRVLKCRRLIEDDQGT